mgnify:CR=1 FL=1
MVSIQDENIVFLELTLRKNAASALSAEIVQTGHNATVRKTIHSWARLRGASIVDHIRREVTTYHIEKPVPSPGQESEKVLARVLDHYLDLYCSGQSVFGERLVVDVPMGQVSGPHGISERLETIA